MAQTNTVSVFVQMSAVTAIGVADRPVPVLNLLPVNVGSSSAFYSLTLCNFEQTLSGRIQKAVSTKLLTFKRERRA